MRVLLAIGGLLILINVLGFARSAPRYAPGVLVPNEPQQTHSDARPFKIKDFLVTPLQEYRITGRVVARNSYWIGTEAELSPLDLGLVWGELSDQSVLDQVSFYHSSRFLHWRSEHLPLPHREINESVSNNHLIPANKLVERQLDRITDGQIVTLEGKLVKIERPDGWRWESSLRRDDTGAGACEVLYVERVSAQPLPTS